VTDWIGSSPDVAKMHYLQTHEEHFRRATGNNRGTARGLNLHAPSGIAPQGTLGAMSEAVDNTIDSDPNGRLAEVCESELAPQTLCGSNTLLVWLKRVHVLERGLEVA